MNSAGYVYVLSNQSMPGILKIGRSAHSGRKRAGDLFSGATGVPTPFKMEFEIWSEDCHEDEILVHEKLQRERISQDREFFRIEVIDAIKAVCEVVLSSHDLGIGHIDEIICLSDLYHYLEKLKDVLDDEFQEVPHVMILGYALRDHLSANQIKDAVIAYEKWVENRKRRPNYRSLELINDEDK